MERYEYTWYPKEFYATVEMLMGLMLSVWYYVTSHYRNNDCFSTFWRLAMSVNGWAGRFDRKWVWLSPGEICLTPYICSTFWGYWSGYFTITKPLSLAV